MNILVITNLYPPDFIGGYELGCKLLVDEFLRKGQQVSILTSGAFLGNEDHIYRLFPFFGFDDFESAEQVHSYSDRIESSLPLLQQFFSNNRFDCILLFNPSGIPAYVTDLIQKEGTPITALVSDDWPAREHELDHFSSAWLSYEKNLLNCYSEPDLIKMEASLFHRKLIGIPNPWNISKAFFVSNFLKLNLQARFSHLSPELLKVVHWGLPTEHYSSRGGRKFSGKLLYCSQLIQKKGLFDLVDAISILRDDGIHVHVSVYGTSPIQSDRRALEQRIDEYSLRDLIEIHAPIKREVLVGSIMGDFDMFLLGSLNDEPFSIAALEAMRAGLAIITTGTGGGAELFVDNVNALLYKGRDPNSLASKIKQLFDEPFSFEALTANSVRTVETYRIESMATAILSGLVSGGIPNLPSSSPSPGANYLTEKFSKLLSSVINQHQLTSILAEKDQYVTSLTSTIEAKDAYSLSLKTALTKKDEQILSLQNTLTKKDEQILSLQNTLTEKDIYALSMQKALGEKVTYAASLYDLSESLNAKLAAMTTTLAELTTTLERTEQMYEQSSRERAELLANLSIREQQCRTYELSAENLTAELKRTHMDAFRDRDSLRSALDASTAYATTLQLEIHSLNTIISKLDRELQPIKAFWRPLKHLLLK